MTKHVITFDKAKNEIRINGLYAGFIDGSENMNYEAVEDEHGLKIMVTETVKLHSPLPDGRTSITCAIMILRPFLVEERAKERREYRKGVKRGYDSLAHSPATMTEEEAIDANEPTDKYDEEGRLKA